MKLFFILYVFALLFVQCDEGDHKIDSGLNTTISQDSIKIDTSANTIGTRFAVPDGYRRWEAVSQLFGYYLRNLPLKPYGSPVKLYDGRIKDNEHVYISVVDLPIGNRDLHQCADAVMRLRAEYLWNEKRYSEIHFNYTNGFKAEYEKWMSGQRIVVEGNKTYYSSGARASNTHDDLWNYLQQVFTYCGTLSLSKEMKPIDVKNMQPGDVFIKGGSPGHAVIIVDMAIHKETGEKIFLLAQSYMPAQEIQILINPKSKELSPWFSAEFGEYLVTPEWTFYPNELKRF